MVIKILYKHRIRAVMKESYRDHLYTYINKLHVMWTGLISPFSTVYLSVLRATVFISYTRALTNVYPQRMVLCGAESHIKITIYFHIVAREMMECKSYLTENYHPK